MIAVREWALAINKLFIPLSGNLFQKTGHCCLEIDYPIYFG